MAPIKDTFVSSIAYNSLPNIREVSDVPEEQAKELESLRALLAKHNVPRGISVRLIHKHYDTRVGEVMVFKRLAIPSYGDVQVMQPVAASEASKLKSLHYFVDNDGSLQSYEYTASDEVVDLSNHQPFVDEFCRFVTERGLGRKFGIKATSEPNDCSFKEFEFPAERSTIMIPEGLPSPVGEFDISITTEWNAAPGNKGAASCCHHFNNSCNHCSHETSHVDGCGAEMVLGGQKIDPGTPVWRLVHAITEVW